MIIQIKSIIFTCIFLCLGHFLSAQSYKVTTEIKVVKSNGINVDTLYNAWAGGMQAPQFGWIDINKDGKKDILTFDRMDRKFVPYLNISHTGESKYRYTPRFSSIFDTCNCAGWAQIIDYDCDGLEDVVCGNVYSNVTIYKQYAIGQDSLGFQLITDVLYSKYNFGSSSLYVALSDIPAVGDVDGDGDIDILTFGNISNYVEWHKNKALELYGRCDTFALEADTYCWGHFWEDNSSNTAHLNDTVNCDLNGFVPHFKTNADEPEEERHAGSTMLMLDLNDNQLQDLVIGDISYSDLYAVYNNAGETSHAYIDSVQVQFPSYHNEPVDIDFFPASFYGDYNNDGIKDLLCAPNLRTDAENYHAVSTHINQGTNTNPDFHYVGKGFLQDENIEYGSNANPVFFDYNKDGKMDILIGNQGYYNTSDSLYYTTIGLMENIGTTDVPLYKVIQDYTGWAITNAYPNLKQASPAVSDLDKDGDQDLLLGNVLGTLYHFDNDAPSGQPAHFKYKTDNFQNINVGLNSAPTFYDIDNDGDEDLFIGNGKGWITYCKNNSVPNNILFDTVTTRWGFLKINDATNNPLSKGYAKPYFADYDNDGQMELLVGDVIGNIRVFENLPNNAIDTLDDAGFLVNYDFGSYASITAAVIDSTNKLSYIIGNEKGGLQLYKFQTIKDVDTSVIAIEPLYQATFFHLYPNPAQDKLTVEIENPSHSPSEVQIMNALGQTLQQEYVEGNLIQMDVSRLPSGIYFVQIKLANQTAVQRLSILR